MKNLLFAFFLLSGLALLGIENHAFAAEVVYENPKFFKNDDAAQAAKPAVKVGIGSAPKNFNGALNLPAGAETHIDNTHAPVNLQASEISAEKPKIQTECDSENKICLTSYIYKDRIILEAMNKAPATYSLIMHFFLNNMQLQENSDTKNIVLKGNEKKTIEVLTVTDPSRTYGYNYDFNTYFGIIDARHDDNFAYDLPFDVDKEFMLIQGVGGRFSHSSEDQYYSYDFKMPVGTSVLAARDGVVVKIVQSFTEGGVNQALKNKANYIYIQHDDGTIAAYAHIKAGGALVSEGDKVQKGQKVALSGDTGYTTIPHLHFGVFKVVSGGRFVSVPVKMKTSEGVFERLSPGEIYRKNMQVGGDKKPEQVVPEVIQPQQQAPVPVPAPAPTPTQHKTKLFR